MFVGHGASIWEIVAAAMAVKLAAMAVKLNSLTVKVNFLSRQRGFRR